LPPKEKLKWSKVPLEAGKAKSMQLPRSFYYELS